MSVCHLYYHIRTLVLFVLCAVIALLLGACDVTVETDLTLRTDERFDATTRVTAPIAAFVSAGGTEEDIDIQLKLWEEGAKATGVNFSWQKEKIESTDEVVYLLSLSGKGYDRLKELFSELFDIEIEKYFFDDEEVLLVSAEPNYTSEVRHHVVRLHVGKILQTNSQRMDNNTILWTGDDTLEAVVMPVGDMRWPMVLAVVLAAAALVALFVFLLFGRRPARQVAQTPTVGSFAQSGGFCPYCGQPSPAGAQFCMYCGQAIPPRAM